MGYGMGGDQNWLKISAPLPLTKVFRISPLLADSFCWAVPKQLPYIRHIFQILNHDYSPATTFIFISHTRMISSMNLE
jgi:hypothetical protein